MEKYLDCPHYLYKKIISKVKICYLTLFIDLSDSMNLVIEMNIINVINVIKVINLFVGITQMT